LCGKSLYTSEFTLGEEDSLLLHSELILGGVGSLQSNIPSPDKHIITQIMAMEIV
jgi:hypothetical protein